MTRVLVLGGSGMLGHKLVQVLGEGHETWATIRDAEPTGPVAAILDPARTIGAVNANDPDSVERAISRSGAEVVVNAIGVIKQVKTARSEVPTIRINALFPHEVAEICARTGSRLIHVSTDCVFSGRRGGYTEDDIPDATDLYGRSKLLGEVTGPGALTLRTSIVGRELTGADGLFEWFLSERGGRVRGFSKAIFSGLTTGALARLIGDLIGEHPDLDGLWQVSADPIDKYELLALLRSALEADIEITPDDSLVIDRSLDSSRFRERTGWSPQGWPEMLAALAADPTPYDRLRESDS